MQPDLPELASFGQRRRGRPLGLAVADFLRSRARQPRPSPLHRASPRRRLDTTAPLVLPAPGSALPGDTFPWGRGGGGARWAVGS